MGETLSIRALTAGDEQALEEVARRMRATLEEVLGADRGRAMYSLAWLRERARQHLAPEVGAVFVAERGGERVGHTIVRAEAGHGLFSTTYVMPARRRGEVASRLLDHGEAWMRARGLSRAATCTDRDNVPLIRLFEARGYALVLSEGAMVRLERAL